MGLEEASNHSSFCNASCFAQKDFKDPMVDQHDQCCNVVPSLGFAYDHFGSAITPVPVPMPVEPTPQAGATIAAGHIYTCRVCGKEVSQEYLLEIHSRETGHQAICCSSAGCDQGFTTIPERNAHQRRPHSTDHGRSTTIAPWDCVECGQSLLSKANLLRHAKEMQHRPYSCKCGAMFSRLDVLNRHLEKFGSDEPQFPCKYCKRHRGPEGFRRRDHLMQHIRNYHHLELDDEANEDSSSRLKFDFPVCSQADCAHYRDESFKALPRSLQDQDKPFSTRAAYTKHMRDEHNISAFPCDVHGCERVGRRGYFREKDMIKHRKDAHPEAPAYRPSARQMKYTCTEAGCGVLLDLSSLSAHQYWVHEQKRGYRGLLRKVPHVATESNSTTPPESSR